MKTPESDQEASPSTAGSDYQTVCDAWTRQGRIYDGLDVKLISAATFQSGFFRQAYAEEYARLYKMKGPEKEKLVADQKTAAGAYLDFIFTAYVPEKNWDDFSKKTSMWKIYLTHDGSEQIRPLEIRKLKNNEAVLSYFYPYMSPWKSTYRIRFPVNVPGTDKNILSDDSDAITLHITSVLGSVEMKWAY